MAIIFFFSHRPGEISSGDSYEIGLKICNALVTDFEKLELDEQMNYAKAIDHPIRKLAHFYEYMILAILLVGVFYKTKNIKLYLLSWIITILYAISDEIHQLFVVGRDGNAVDVIIDSAGGLFGVIICLFINREIHKLR